MPTLECCAIRHISAQVLATVGALEDRLKRHEDLLEELDKRLQETDSQVAQLWKQMDKVSILELQQKEQELKTKEIQRWCQQLTKTREQEALDSEERFFTLQGDLSLLITHILVVRRCPC